MENKNKSNKWDSGDVKSTAAKELVSEMKWQATKLEKILEIFIIYQYSNTTQWNCVECDPEPQNGPKTENLDKWSNSRDQTLMQQRQDQISIQKNPQTSYL